MRVHLFRRGLARLGLLAVLVASGWLSAELIKEVLAHGMTPLPALLSLRPFAAGDREVADRVWIWRAGQLEVLLLDAESQPKPAAAIETRGLALKRKGPGRFAVDRDQLQALLANPGSLLKDARVVPGGKGGYRIFAIRPDSLYARLGLKNGDVLRRVNGHGVDDPERLLEIFQRLKSARQVELEFERRGQSQRLELEIR